MFKAPLFREQSVDRELTAVDNEFLRDVGEDKMRIFHLIKQEVKKGMQLYHDWQPNF